MGAGPAWAASYRWEHSYGYDYLYAGPLFTHQLSHIWVDFRGIQDAFMRAKGIDYFENSRRATYVQRQYALDNPFKFAHYGEHCWGLTASDGLVRTPSPSPASSASSSITCLLPFDRHTIDEAHTGPHQREPLRPVQPAPALFRHLEQLEHHRQTLRASACALRQIVGVSSAWNSKIQLDRFSAVGTTQ